MSAIRRRWLLLAPSVLGALPPLPGGTQIGPASAVVIFPERRPVGLTTQNTRLVITAPAVVDVGRRTVPIVSRARRPVARLTTPTTFVTSIPTPM